ncbi:MAG: glycosyltransferase [Candidatus Lokiarchaeota archaeon]|nr:glycosyltransferase [Candidatus Lokiarchaeota archaeon]
MILAILSHGVTFPLSNHRSTEFVQRLRRFSDHFEKIYIITHEFSHGFLQSHQRDDKSKNIILIKTQAGLIKGQIAISKILQRIAPDVIYSDTLSDANIAFLYLLTSKTPLVTTMRGWDSDVLTQELALHGQNWLAIPVRLLWPLRDLLVFKRSSKVLTVTKGLARYAEKLIGRNARSRVETVFRSMQYCREIPESTREHAEELKRKIQTQYSDESKLLVTVARLSPGKRIDIAIDALNLIREDHPSAHLIIVGDGIERNRLEQQVKRMSISEHVTFLGRVPRDMVLAIHEISDAMLFPSVSEGFAKAPHEALIIESPVICHNFPGAAGLGFDEACIMIDSLNPTEYAEAIRQLFDSSKLREKLIRNGRLLTRKYLKWSNNERVDFIANILKSAANA